MDGDRLGGHRRVSIYALLAERDTIDKEPQRLYDISIHALLAERDIEHYTAILAAAISIHALLAERDAKLDIKPSFITYSGKLFTANMFFLGI